MSGIDYSFFSIELKKSKEMPFSNTNKNVKKLAKYYYYFVPKSCSFNDFGLFSIDSNSFPPIGSVIKPLLKLLR